MRSTIGYCVIAAIVFGMARSVESSIQEAQRDVVTIDYPYSRGLDSELARILLIPPRTYNTKRNSELINSLLGLPKNMNNAGK